MTNPIKYNLKKELPSLFFIVFIIVFSFIAYPSLGDKIASHWNFAGQVDGWSNKSSFIYFFPGLIIVMYGFMTLMPIIDPKKESYAGFAQTYINFKTLMVGILSAIYAITIFSNLGYDINIGKTVSLLIGGMMILIGFMLKNIKSNWFIGVRTPWTMSSPLVWEKTHKISAYSFSFLGLCIIIAPYLSNPWNITVFAIGLVQAVIGTMAYSYIIYRKEKNKK